MSASIDPENPTPRRATGVRCCLATCICVVLLLIPCTGLGLFLADLDASTHYSVAIDSASGLAPPAPSPTNLTLDHVEFNLTLRIASPDSLWSWKCMDAGKYVEVSYGCVPLDASAATPDKLCVGPRKSRDEHIVARGIHVQLPAYMMVGLMADIRSGVEAFGITLKQSVDDVRVALGVTGMGMMAAAASRTHAPSRAYTECMTSCGARRVGGDVAPCY